MGGNVWKPFPLIAEQYPNIWQSTKVQEAKSFNRTLKVFSKNV